MIDLLEFIKTSERKMRHTMPQIKDFEAFSKDLKENEIEQGSEKVDASGLRPTQKNFNQAKVDDMKETGDWKKKPIIISSDDFIIDGHHRWLAAKQLKEKIEVCRVDLEATEVLDFVKGKAYVETKGVKE